MTKPDVNRESKQATTVVYSSTFNLTTNAQTCQSTLQPNNRLANLTANSLT